MTSLYTPLLTIHNYLRWVILVLLFYTLIRAYLRWFTNKPWGKRDQKASLFLTSALDTQLLLGMSIFGVLQFSIANQMLTEHIIPMVIAVIIAHVGKSRSQKTDQDVNKHKQSAIWFTIALLIIILSIPWYRPLLRGF